MPTDMRNWTDAQWMEYGKAKAARNEKAKADPRVIAIRACPAVGRGTCSTIDECYEASEIVDTLDENGHTTVRQALEWAWFIEDLQMDKMMNQRWGEDADPEIGTQSDWQKRLALAKAALGGE